jgi:hypothetical protein
MHIGAADACPLGLYEDIVWGGELGDWAVLVDDFVFLLQDERWVLGSY